MAAESNNTISIMIIDQDFLIHHVQMTEKQAEIYSKALKLPNTLVDGAVVNLNYTN